jgi:hypothetical protein
MQGGGSKSIKSQRVLTSRIAFKKNEDGDRVT